MTLQQQCKEKSSEFCYTNMSSNNPTTQFQNHEVNHIHTFVSDPTEMFNLTTSMEMIGFSKNLHQQQQEDFTPAGTPSHENLIVHHDSVAWQQENRNLLVDDSSLRCLFPSQGLSLSLSSTSTTNPFEPRHHIVHQQQQQMLQGGFLMNSTKVATNIYNHQGQEQSQSQFLLKNSKFLAPLQDLLNEFCSLGTKQDNLVLKQKSLKINKQPEEDNSGSGSSIINHSLTSLEFVELQKKKTKLLSMLEEVNRKYKNYCNQMKAVVSSFEAIAGNGAAIVYSTLALKAMSRHFKCLKDGILDQIEITRKTMGEKDPVTPGATRGETPRLRILDRAIRQQRTFQQINTMMETQTQQPWRPQRGLPECSVSVLRAWLFEHFLHPYPSDVDKHILARQTGLSKSQVSNWFINARVRLWKPMVEEMYLEEEKEQQRNATSSEGGANNENDITICTTNVVENTSSPTYQKPTEARLLRIDSECVSSIINNTDHKNNSKNLNPREQCNSTRATDTSGSVDLDFSSFTQHSSDMVIDQSFHGGSGVSLTLGLQQHGGNGVSLAFQAASTPNPMFFTREQIEECQTVHEYSLLDGQNMQYRNLMGTQLLHDIA